MCCIAIAAAIALVSIPFFFAVPALIVAAVALVILVLLVILALCIKYIPFFKKLARWAINLVLFIGLKFLPCWLQNLIRFFSAGAFATILRLLGLDDEVEPPNVTPGPPKYPPNDPNDCEGETEPEVTPPKHKYS